MSRLIISPSGVTPPVFTWATKPAATGFVGMAFISDIGVNGSMWTSNGVKWVISSPVILAIEDAGIVFPSLATSNAATYSQTGTTITVTSTGHSIPATVHDGKDVYLISNTGALVTGRYTSFTRVDANTFTCVSGISQAITGTLTTNTGLVSFPLITLPADLLGIRGSIETPCSVSMPNSSVVKTITAKLGGSTYSTNTYAAGIVSVVLYSGFKNVTAGKQIAISAVSTLGYGQSASALLVMAEDTTVGKIVSTNLQLSAADSYLVLENISVVFKQG